MLYLIIKSYLTILIAVGLGAAIVFSLGLYFILRPRPAKLKAEKPARREPPVLHAVQDDEHTLEDISAIAGEDLIVTQLDLARAYIETGKPSHARGILRHVLAEGSQTQQQEAQRLMQHI